MFTDVEMPGTGIIIENMTDMMVLYLRLVVFYELHNQETKLTLF